MSLSVTFVSRARNAVSVLWDFGDGSQSTEQNPEHTYIDAGVYIVTLTVTGPYGKSTARQAVTVTGAVTEVLLAASDMNVLATAGADLLAIAD